MTGGIAMGGNKIIGLANGTANTEAVTKHKWTPPCRRPPSAWT